MITFLALIAGYLLVGAAFAVRFALGAKTSWRDRAWAVLCWPHYVALLWWR